LTVDLIFDWRFDRERLGLRLDLDLRGVDGGAVLQYLFAALPDSDPG
jgi:hypothetical protein